MNSKFCFSIYVMVFVMFTANASAQVATRGGYTLDPTVIAGGGGTSTDANNTFRLDGTIGQPLTAASRGTGSDTTTYVIYSGFHPAAFEADTVFTEALPLTADTWVQGAEAFRNTNFGSSPELQVKRTLNPGNGRGRRTFLRFDTNNVTGEITRARLRIFARLTDATLPPTGMIVQKVTDTTWDEFAVTWNNQPVTASPNALARIIVTGAEARYYEFDLTALLQAERAAGRNVVSLRLINQAPTGNSGASYTVVNSKEAATNQPQLVIEQ